MPSWSLHEDTLTEEEAAVQGRIAVRIAVVLTAAFVILLAAALAFGISAAGASEPTRTVGKAVYGYGQISYGGRGPEKWRWQVVVEKRERQAVENRYAGKLRKANRTIRRLQSAQRREAAHFFSWLANADCIYRHERGADGWATNTGNGFDGGMQADDDFQQAYGWVYLQRWGPAYLWPWWAQLHMAYNGYLARGWQPWPNTSIACGLR